MQNFDSSSASPLRSEAAGMSVIRIAYMHDKILIKIGEGRLTKWDCTLLSIFWWVRVSRQPNVVTARVVAVRQALYITFGLRASTSVRLWVGSDVVIRWNCIFGSDELVTLGGFWQNMMQRGAPWNDLYL